MGGTARPRILARVGIKTSEDLVCLRCRCSYTYRLPSSVLGQSVASERLYRELTPVWSVLYGKRSQFERILPDGPGFHTCS